MIGPLLAYTITLPLGYFLTEPGARNVFLPQIMPEDFVESYRDAVAAASARIPRQCAGPGDAEGGGGASRRRATADIKVPVVVITGDADKTVSPDIHSRPFAAAVPDAKLIVLPGVGHMVQNAAPELVVREIDAMIGKIARSTAAAAN